MIREGHDNASFFIGTEVENTPVKGKKTLFVIGVQSVDDIQARLHDAFCSTGSDIEHIYFGANMSFPKLAVDSKEWDHWADMIWPFLEKGYFCTLDIDSYSVEGLLETGLTEHHMFIPMISVKLPYLQLLGYNATIKLDDKDFKATNPGVWCHSLHDLLDRSKFTGWEKYTKDSILK